MKETWEDDRDPLAALRDGDSALFEAFVRRELKTFLGFFLRLGASRVEAEDLVQDLNLKLFQHARSYRAQGRFAAYAFRVARNLLIDRRRRRAVRPVASAGGGSALDGDEQPAWLDQIPDRGSEEPQSALLRREEALRVRAALLELSERQRLVFELGVVQELPYHEIGSILEIPVGTVKSRMFHAVRKLQELLGVERQGGEAR
ncbi:MAG: RNA polymerase sigma factor [Planctomycetota bacterium]